MAREHKRIIKDVADITAKRDAEMAKGGKMQKFQEQLKDLVKELTKARTQVDLKRSTIAEDEKRVFDSQEAKKDLERQKVDRQTTCRAITEKCATFKESYDASAASLKQTESLLQTLITGLSSSASDAESTNTGYMGQIATARNKASTSTTEVEQCKARIEHLARELKEKEPRGKQAAKDDSGLVKELEKARENATQLERELASLDWDDSQEERLLQRREQANRELRELMEKKDVLKSRLASLEFNYTSPSRDFDKSKVKGLIANLVKLDKDKFDFSTALEVCAGGRLYNVVVENERIGSQLLDNGKLTKRVTMIPLNKIQAFVASAEVYTRIWPLRFCN